MSELDISIENIIEWMFYISISVQLVYLIFIYSKSLFVKPNTDIVDFKEPVSVVICARNEYENLKVNLPKLLSQNYHQYEVVVVNDRSWDSTGELLEQMGEEYSNLKIVSIPENDKNTFAGKKFAKTLGVKAAKFEYLLFTDADCEPSSDNWIYEMAKNFLKNDVLIGVSPLKGGKGFWAFLSRMDSFFIAYNYISFTLSKLPYMAVGRNMATTKSKFFEVKGFKSHYNIPSGDDDLFVRDVKKNSKISLVFHPDTLTFSEPNSSFLKWIKQKKRHFLTAPKYSVFNKLLLGIYSLTYLMLIISFISLLVVKSLSWVIVGLFAIRYVLHITFVYNPLKLMGEANKTLLFPVMELMLFCINTMIYYSNLFLKPNKW